MKSKFFTCLLLATALSSGFAATSTVSTLAQRDAMVKEALSKSSEDALKAINEAQQSGQIKTDDQNYVVVIKIVEPGAKYERVAHSKKEKLEEKTRAVEASLEETVKQAEKELANTSGPIPFNFSANGKTLYAVLLKKDAYMIFNICEKKDEMDALLKPADKPVEKPAETTPVAASPVVADKPVDTPAAATPAPDKAVTPDAKAADTTKAAAKVDEKKQEVATAAVNTPAATTTTSDKAPDAKPADAPKEQTKTESSSVEKKPEAAPAAAA
jgi:hypothetical protein